MTCQHMYALTRMVFNEPQGLCEKCGEWISIEAQKAEDFKARIDHLNQQVRLQMSSVARARVSAQDAWEKHTAVKKENASLRAEIEQLKKDKETLIERAHRMEVTL